MQVRFKRGMLTPVFGYREGQVVEVGEVYNTTTIPASDVDGFLNSGIVEVIKAAPESATRGTGETAMVARATRRNK